MTKNETKRPSFGVSFVILLFLIVVLVAQVIATGSPSIRMTLIYSTAFAALVLMVTGTSWKIIEEGILHGCSIAAVPNVIMILIGMLIPAWIAAGSIPALIYYGLQIINPSFFLVTVAIVCSVASISTGSSYTTGATFGVAFIGISIGLGIPTYMTAGAVISGAIIGDKLSPLSDSTNLAAGVCETNLFDHIKSMMYTTIPAFVISLVLYAVIGLRYSADSIDTSAVQVILDGISQNFNITPLYAIVAIIPMAIVIVLGLKKVNAIITMVIAGVVGMIIAIVMQKHGILEMINFMDSGYIMNTGIADVDKLLSRGGIQSMMWTVSVAILGMIYGGVLEKAGVLDVLLDKMVAITKSARSLIITHVFSSIIINLLSASQYVAILIPGRMFLPAYKKLGIDLKVASRTCEDSATVTSPLVPWGLCGVYFAGVLGVDTLAYLPYTFLALLVPLISIFYACTGIFIFKKEVKTDNKNAQA
ncbi:MAG: Na+/H+ antiporter NhaC [Clostridium sp.]|uniref:Na+/H+ antiporter NhaC n=1 Tax=Clostridium sp. TaxID=1506 RepID=UPI00302C7082